MPGMTATSFILTKHVLGYSLSAAAAEEHHSYWFPFVSELLLLVWLVLLLFKWCLLFLPFFIVFFYLCMIPFLPTG